MERQIAGDEGHSQVVGGEHRQSLTVTFHVVLDVAALSAEVERIIIVDRSRDEHVEKALPVVGDGTVDGTQTGVARLLRWCSELHLHVVVKHRKEVQMTVAGLRSVLDDGELGTEVEDIVMVCGNLWRAIYNRCTQIEDLCIGESLENQLVAYAVGVALGDCYAYSFVVHNYFVFLFLFSCFYFFPSPSANAERMEASRRLILFRFFASGA